MALKGKKRSRSRGSQARRRPGAAPRAAPLTARHVPWYRTAAGQVGAVVALMLVSGAIVGLIANARGNAAEKQRRQEVLEDYAGEIRALLQEVRGPVAAMPTALTEDPESLASDAERWVEELQKAQAALPPAPPTGMDTTNALVSQAVQMFVGAARTYELVAAIDEKKARDRVFSSALEQRTQADALWLSAVRLLDDELADVGGDPSGVGSPSTSAPAAAPSPTAGFTIEPPDGSPAGDGSGGGDGKSKKGKK